jgi:hypothetical protein
VRYSENFGKAVAFVGGSLEHADSTDDLPLRGTGFIVEMPSADPAQVFLYVVTAAHVVRPLATRFIRLSRPDRSTFDLRIAPEDWSFHPSEDVAVGQFGVDPAEVSIAVIPTSDFVGRSQTQFAAGPGDEVFFAGLLGLVASMGSRRIPMTRTGTIGALHQDGIPVRQADGTVVEVHGHLIDCRSFGGFSGSPCFVRFLSGIDTTPRMGLKVPKESTLLLGLVSGHFDLAASVALPDQTDEIRIPVAAGIAVVLPSDTILEVLESDELREGRESQDYKTFLASAMTDEIDERGN